MWRRGEGGEAPEGRPWGALPEDGSSVGHDVVHALRYSCMLAPRNGRMFFWADSTASECDRVAEPSRQFGLDWGRDRTQKTGADQPWFRCPSAIRGSSHKRSASPIGCERFVGAGSSLRDVTSRLRLWPNEGAHWWRVIAAACWNWRRRGIPILDATGTADSRSARGHCPREFG